MQILEVHQVCSGGRGSGSDSGEAPASKEEALSLGKRLRTEIREFHAELIAGVATKLEAVPEGEGNMLDNTMIIYISESGARHHPKGGLQMPFYTVGNIHGRFKTGQYLQFPSRNQKGHRTLSNFYTSLLRAAGDSRPHFGMKDLSMDPSFDQDGTLEEVFS